MAIKRNASESVLMRWVKLESIIQNEVSQKEKHKYCILSLTYLTYMRSTSSKMPGWMKHKLESRLPGETSITSDMQMTPPLWQKVKRS